MQGPLGQLSRGAMKVQLILTLLSPADRQFLFVICFLFYQVHTGGMTVIPPFPSSITVGLVWSNPSNKQGFSQVFPVLTQTSWWGGHKALWLPQETCSRNRCFPVHHHILITDIYFTLWRSSTRNKLFWGSYHSVKKLWCAEPGQNFHLVLSSHSDLSRLTPSLTVQGVHKGTNEIFTLENKHAISCMAPVRLPLVRNIWQ